MMRYAYLGDALTRPELRGMSCDPVYRADGKCIVSTSMATALVVDEQGQKHVVKRRRLRLRKESDMKLTASVKDVTFLVETSGDLCLSVAGVNGSYLFTLSDRRDQGVIFQSKPYRRKPTCVAAGRKKMRATIELLARASKERR